MPKSQKPQSLAEKLCGQKNIALQAGNVFPEDTAQRVIAISSKGGTPLVVVKNNQVQGVIELQDIIKTGMKVRF